VRFLVRQGQLDVVGGGWVSHDEGLASPRGILNGLTLGRRRLTAAGIAPPSVSWQIDAFGHGSSTAELLAALGYKGHVLNRVHYRRKEEMRAGKLLDFHWNLRSHLSSTCPSSRSLLTTVLDGHYAAPTDLDFENSPLLRWGEVRCGGRCRGLQSRPIFLHSKFTVECAH
jgi:lysosomal alpha-mannosidase